MYGESAKSWESVISFYLKLKDHHASFSDMAALATQLAQSPYCAAGLCATTSMHDLILGPTSQVLDNPHLIVRPDFESRRFTLLYQDGSAQPWSKTVEAKEAYSAIVRVMTKYAHWYDNAD